MLLNTVGVPEGLSCRQRSHIRVQLLALLGPRWWRLRGGGGGGGVSGSWLLIGRSRLLLISGECHTTVLRPRE